MFNNSRRAYAEAGEVDGRKVKALLTWIDGILDHEEDGIEADEEDGIEAGEDGIEAGEDGIEAGDDEGGRGARGDGEVRR